MRRSCPTFVLFWRRSTAPPALSTWACPTMQVSLRACAYSTPTCVSMLSCVHLIDRVFLAENIDLQYLRHVHLGDRRA